MKINQRLIYLFHIYLLTACIVKSPHVFHVFLRTDLRRLVILILFNTVLCLGSTLLLWALGFSNNCLAVPSKFIFSSSSIIHRLRIKIGAATNTWANIGHICYWMLSLGKNWLPVDIIIITWMMRRYVCDQWINGGKAFTDHGCCLPLERTSLNRCVQHASICRMISRQMGQVDLHGWIARWVVGSISVMIILCLIAFGLCCVLSRVESVLKVIVVPGLSFFVNFKVYSSQVSEWTEKMVFWLVFNVAHV